MVLSFLLLNTLYSVSADCLSSFEAVTTLSSRCAYPAAEDTVTVICNIIGTGTTVFQGSAFDCESSNNAITLLHSRFNITDGTNGICNNGDIVGHSVKVEDNCYTSQVNVTVSSDLIGKTIECIHDNGTTTETVGKYSLTSETVICGSDPAVKGNIFLSIGVIIAVVLSCTVVLIGTALGLIIKRRQVKPLKVSNYACANSKVPPKGSDLEASELKPITRCVPTKEVTGSEVYRILSDIDRQSIIITNDNYSQLKSTASHNLESIGSIDRLDQQNYSSDRRLKDESLDLDSLLIMLRSRVNNQLWYQFGLVLGVPQQFLEKLKGYPVEECMIELVDHWLRNHPDNPTWKEINAAIENVLDFKLENRILGVYDLAVPLMHVNDQDTMLSDSLPPPRPPKPQQYTCTGTEER